ncbi:MYXO-CTERM sorting domain-containing protein [Patescibacteria group bacterium]|nr:MYXO-CTERM sorting domain-containing protein [Patescibacteria group bacterium]
MEKRIRDLELSKAHSAETGSEDVSQRRSSISRKIMPLVLGAGLIGCGNQEMENIENIGSVEQMSVAAGYQSKTLLPAPISNNQTGYQEFISSAKDLGIQWEIYFSAKGSGNQAQDVFWAIIDKSTLQTVQGPSAVNGASLPLSDESNFVPCGGKAYYLTDKDFLSRKLFQCDIVNATTVNNCATVPNINTDNFGVDGLACGSNGQKLYVARQDFGQDGEPYVATIGVWNWTKPLGCAEPGTDLSGISFTNQHFVYNTINGSLPTGGRLLKYKNFNGSQCTGAQQDIGDLYEANVDFENPLVVNGGIFYSRAIQSNGNYNPYFAQEKPGQGGNGGGGAGGMGAGGSGAGGMNTGGTGGQGGTGPEGGGGAGGNTGGSGAGGNPEGGGGNGGGTAGGGGAPVDCMIMDITNNPENIEIDSCDDAEVSGHLLGPSVFVIGSKTFTINDVVPNTPGGFSFTMPNQSQFDNGIAKNVKEDEADPKKKLIDRQYGGITGYEGTEVEDSIPGSAEINPDLEKGDINVICTETLDGAQRKYVKDGCDPANLESCDPDDRYTTAGAEAGVIPKGTKLCTELKSGKVSSNPDDFKNAQELPPVPGEPDCNCSTPGQVTDSTYGALLALGLIAAAGLRRRNDF